MIKALEQNQEKERALPPEVIKEIKQEGEELYFIGNYGSHFGHVLLPKIMPNPRGKWQKDEFYTVSDWVVFEHKTYACIKTHVALVFESEQDNWRLVIDPKLESTAL